eukprot:6179595-Pleurochrysis_carterae.AAC.2
MVAATLRVLSMLAESASVAGMHACACCCMPTSSKMMRSVPSVKQWDTKNLVHTCSSTQSAVMH